MHGGNQGGDCGCGGSRRKKRQCDAIAGSDDCSRDGRRPAEQCCAHGPCAVNVIVYVSRARERFVFMFADCQRKRAILAVRRHLDDPEIDFNASDAREVILRMLPPETAPSPDY